MAEYEVIAEAYYKNQQQNIVATTLYVYPDGQKVVFELKGIKPKTRFNIEIKLLEENNEETRIENESTE